MASLFENIGLEPIIVLVPGHAFVGVKETPESNTINFIETTQLSRGLHDNTVWDILWSKQNTFETAIQTGAKEFDDNR